MRNRLVPNKAEAAASTTLKGITEAVMKPTCPTIAVGNGRRHTKNSSRLFKIVVI